VSAAAGIDPHALDAPDAVVPRRRWGLLRAVARRPAGAFGLAVAALVVLMVLFAPLLAPYDPDTPDLANRFASPSLEHLLGTDNLGRDLLSRVIYGGRVAFAVALPAVAGAVAIGLLLGLLAGWFGRLVDSVLIVVTDALLAFPAVVLALAVIALYGPSIRNTILLVGIAFVPGYFRVARALVLAARNDVYVDAERALGATTRRILAAHVLPNVLPPIFILVAMDIPGAIAVESGLSFLGLGVQPPTADWGTMLNEGFQDVYDSPWPLIAPCAALVLVTLGFTFLGETLRDVADPRVARAHGLRRRGRR
jgi:peptide/nickel transport system permease protein